MQHVLRDRTDHVARACDGGESTALGIAMSTITTTFTHSSPVPNSSYWLHMVGSHILVTAGLEPFGEVVCRAGVAARVAHSNEGATLQHIEPTLELTLEPAMEEAIAAAVDLAIELERLPPAARAYHRTLDAAPARASAAHLRSAAVRLAAENILRIGDPVVCAGEKWWIEDIVPGDHPRAGVRLRSCGGDEVRDGVSADWLDG